LRTRTHLRLAVDCAFTLALSCKSAHDCLPRRQLHRFGGFTPLVRNLCSRHWRAGIGPTSVPGAIGCRFFIQATVHQRYNPVALDRGAYRFSTDLAPGLCGHVGVMPAAFIAKPRTDWLLSLQS
jgi:hypothetical protein